MSELNHIISKKDDIENFIYVAKNIKSISDNDIRYKNAIDFLFKTLSETTNH